MPVRLHEWPRAPVPCGILVAPAAAGASQGAANMSSDGAGVSQVAQEIPTRASERALMSRLLRRGASGAFIVSVAGAALGLLANLVMARLNGRAEYGIYALMFSWVSVLVMVAQAGQDISIIRFLPGYIQDNAW